jgi:hypothetical protein
LPGFCIRVVRQIQLTHELRILHTCSLILKRHDTRLARVSLQVLPSSGQLDTSVLTVLTISAKHSRDR